MRRLLASAAFATLVITATGVSTATALPRGPAGSAEPLAKRVADLDRSAAKPRRKARAHRHRVEAWRDRGVVVTSGHFLHRFRGGIIYTYTVPACCYAFGHRW